MRGRALALPIALLGLTACAGTCLRLKVRLFNQSASISVCRQQELAVQPVDGGLQVQVTDAGAPRD